MKSILRRLKQHFCSHVVSFDNVRRIAPELVECPCNRCGKQLFAPYGVALDARWEPPAVDWLERAMERNRGAS